MPFSTLAVAPIWHGFGGQVLASIGHRHRPGGFTPRVRGAGGGAGLGSVGGGVIGRRASGRVWPRVCRGGVGGVQTGLACLRRWALGSAGTSVTRVWIGGLDGEGRRPVITSISPRRCMPAALSLSIVAALTSEERRVKAAMYSLFRCVVCGA